MRRRLMISIFLVTALIFPLGTGALAYTHDDSLIHWREYSPQVFDSAVSENRPILLFITAVWCHWCHVFEEKVLEIRETADFINGNFVPVFVDYDRRKDLVRKYPAVGLPTTVILSPEDSILRVFPGYMTREVFINRLENLLGGDWAKRKPPAPEGGITFKAIKQPGVDELAAFISSFKNLLRASYDREYGGFGSGVKEPFGHTLNYAMDLYGETGDEELKEMITHTLDRIAGLTKDAATGGRPDADYLFSLYKDKKLAGWLEKVERLQRQHKIVGLLDPVEKGFFRLSILRDWGIPHYEKLLDVNAQMIKAYIHAYQLTGKKAYREIAEGTIGYVLNKLYDPRRGAFYGSQSADEVYYHLTAAERARVDPPPLDTTSYTAATGEIIEALLYAYETFGGAGYREAAENGLNFLEKKMRGKRGLFSYYDPSEGSARIDGQLEDNAWAARSFFKAWRTLKEETWARKALEIMDFSLDELYDTERSGFFERNSTSRGFYKKGEAFSKEKPFAGNGIMTLNLIEAYRYTEREYYLDKARETLGIFVDGPVDPSSPFLLQTAGELIALQKTMVE